MARPVPPLLGRVVGAAGGHDGVGWVGAAAVLGCGAGRVRDGARAAKRCTEPDGRGAEPSDDDDGTAVVVPVPGRATPPLSA